MTLIKSKALQGSAVNIKPNRIFLQKGSEHR